MKKITITDETAIFIKELSQRMKNQNRRATADPYYFCVRCVSEAPVPDGCGNDVRYRHMDGGSPYTEEELRKYCTENELDFEKEKAEWRQFEVVDREEFQNVFLTEDGYNRHMKLNRHNYGNFKAADSYIEHAYRNPELEELFKAIHEIAAAI